MIDLFLFIFACMWIKDFYELRDNEIELNHDIFHFNETDKNQRFLANLMYNLNCYVDRELEHCNGYKPLYRFDSLISIIILFTWIRFILVLKVTYGFGPRIKIMERMSTELGKFLLIWSIIILVITVVAMLIFNQL